MKKIEPVLNWIPKWVGQVATLAVAIALPRFSGAQSVEALTNYFALDEITLTATKSARPVDLTPESVSVIDRATMERRMVQDFDDIYKYQAGVSGSAGPRRIGQRPNIRGLSGDRVLQTLDGARMNFDSGHKGQSFVEPDWLQRVEIIKSPASALYGSGGLGGVVNMRTIEGTDFLRDGQEFGFQQSAGFQGANKELTLTPKVFGRLGEGDKVDYLLSYNLRLSGSIDTGGDNAQINNSSEELHSGLANFVYRPYEGTSLKFGTMQYSSAIGVPPNTSATGPTLVDRETFQSFYNLEFAHQRDANRWLNLNGNLYYTDLNISETQNTDGRVDDINFDTLGVNLRNRTEILDPENRHTAGWTYGFEYFTDKQNATRNGGGNGFFPNAESSHVAGYTQVELKFAEGLFELIPGVRFDNVSQDGVGGFSSEHSSISPKIGGVIKLDRQLSLDEGDHVALAANYTEGFRAPSFSELFASGIHFPGAIFVPSPTLRPETSQSWEVGPRVKIDRYRFKANYFETSAEDFIDYDVAFIPPFGPLTFTPNNVSNAKLRGVELEGGVELGNFDLWSNFTSIRGDNLSAGTPLTSVTPDRLTLGLDYAEKTYGLSPGIRVSYNWKQSRVPGDVAQTPEYTVVDLLLSWKPGEAEKDFGWAKNLEVNFGIDNLLDRGYRQHLASLPEAGINPKVMAKYTWTF